MNSVGIVFPECLLKRRIEGKPGMIANSTARSEAPEEILLERERKPVHRAHGGSRLLNVSLGDG